MSTDIRICPITQQIMTDPVTDRDGNTYERSAITEWLRMHNTSPITRRHMTVSELVPNRIVRELLEAQSGNATSQPVNTQTVQSSTQVMRTSENITGVIVLDASGSMSTSCDITSESCGMTRIDLTKYSARVIIESLKPGDKMGIVTFSSSAYELAPIRQINSEHDKKILIGALDRYTASGSTNIYDAVIKTISVISNAIQPGEPVSVFLLTDGEPTINPPDMHNQGIAKSTLDALSNRLAPNITTQNITINTFGYGYSLLADLMVGLTQFGGAKQGIFGFIPDSTMLGTVLINAMSRARYPKPAELSLGDITLCNQAANIISELCKYDSVSQMAQHELDAFIETLENPFPMDRTPLSDALLMDFKDNSDPNLGQVYKAINPEHYSKWGKYYLMGLSNAFQTRTCLNFKDNALQCFKTSALEQEQSRLSDIFITATPPVPTGGSSYSYGRHSHSSPYAAVNMALYLNAAGGCFGPLTMVDLSNNTHCQITELKAGMRVKTDAGEDTVVCVIKQPYTGTLYEVDPCLFLTAWHPFKCGNGSIYKFPCKYERAHELPCKVTGYSGFTDLKDNCSTGFVYNIVLQNRGVIRSFYDDGSYEYNYCYSATLGHSVTDDPVMAHPYYGTEAVINDLKATGQFESGFINVKLFDVRRDPVTNLVSGITYQVE